jgi:hypothetical protein
MSSVPLAVTIVLTESHTRSAFGSMTACIKSLLSATGLNGGGAGALPQPIVMRDKETVKAM